MLVTAALHSSQANRTTDMATPYYCTYLHLLLEIFLSCHWPVNQSIPWTAYYNFYHEKVDLMTNDASKIK